MATHTTQPVVGHECNLYYNAGTYGTPTWTLITAVMDVNVPFELGEAEMSSRGSAFKKYLATLFDLGLEVSYLYGEAPTEWGVLRGFFLNKTKTEFLVLDGLVADTGAQGPRFYGQIFGMPINQPLEEAATVDFTIKPTFFNDAGTVRDPAWDTVA